MKNLLIATTALVATAGVAAAEINFSGGARFGIRYDESAVDGIQESKITNRMTINIDGTAETDTGVEFFGRVRIRGENNGNGVNTNTAGDALDITENTTPNASGVSAPRVGARIGGLTVATGNILGAIDALPAESARLPPRGRRAFSTRPRMLRRGRGWRPAPSLRRSSSATRRRPPGWTTRSVRLSSGWPVERSLRGSRCWR